MVNEGGRGRGLFDDLAGVAGGAFSVLAGAREEAEALAARVSALEARLAAAEPAAGAGSGDSSTTD